MYTKKPHPVGMQRNVHIAGLHPYGMRIWGCCLVFLQSFTYLKACVMYDLCKMTFRRGLIDEPSSEKSSRRDDSFVETDVHKKTASRRDATRCAYRWVASLQDADLGLFPRFLQSFTYLKACVSRC